MQRFDELSAEQTVDFNTVYQFVFDWSRQVKLDHNPPMPEKLHNRVGDNWRVLFSIADACGPAWGIKAREAAIAFTRPDQQSEDEGVMLLRDTRDIFNRERADRIRGNVDYQSQ